MNTVPMAFYGAGDLRRLRALALSFSIGWGIYLVIWLAGSVLGDLPVSSRLYTALPCFFLALSYAFAVYRQWLSIRLLCALGMAMSFICALAATALYIVFHPYQLTQTAPQNWGLVTGMFMVAVLLPMRLSMATLLLMGAASLPAIGYIGQRLYGLPALPAELLFQWTIAPFLAATVAVMTVWHINRWQSELHNARQKVNELGSYDLVKKLGQGGMGEVWQARHKLLACPAAVKLIRTPPPELEATLKNLFEREAQITALLCSLHTVRVFDFGRTDDGSFYYVMELLTGMNLYQLVRDYGPQPPERVRHFLIQACDALAEAHEIGVVHRDIKPSNLFMCSLGTQRDVIKVLDFGLVLNAAFTSKDPDLQQIGDLRGTPGFMAPEQARTGAAVDGRADLYGLACSAYFMLAGEQVFEAESNLELVRRHATETPIPVHLRSARFMDPAFSDIIMQCLSKDPEHRPESARLLRTMLLDLIDTPEWTADNAETYYRQPPSRRVTRTTNQQKSHMSTIVVSDKAETT